MNDYSHIIVSGIDSISLIKKKTDEITFISDRFCYGLSFCREGELHYWLDEKEYISDPKCAIFLPQGQSYKIISPTAGTFPLINFSCTGTCMPDEFLVLPIASLEPYDRDFEKMSDVIKTVSDCQFRLLSSFYAMMHRLTQDSLSFVDIPPILHPGINYLRNHLCDESLSNDELAKQCHISEVYFRKLFNEVFHVSPHQYIIDKRLERSVDLLKDPSLSIPDIASLCGFSTLCNFYRLFRLRMKCTPSEYRNRNKLY